MVGWVLWHAHPIELTISAPKARARLSNKSSQAIIIRPTKLCKMKLLLTTSSSILLLWLAPSVNAQPIPACKILGPATITHAKPDGVGSAFADFADCITPNVCLTRGNTGSLCNVAPGVTDQCSAFNPDSPTDTEWSLHSTTADDLSTMNFVPFREFGSGDIGGFGISNGLWGVLHLITDDLYMDISVTSWSCCGAGGFTYTRGNQAGGGCGGDPHIKASIHIMFCSFVYLLLRLYCLLASLHLP